MNPEQVQKLLDAAAARLGEHLDGLIIAGTWHADGLTYWRTSTIGNHFARMGLLHELIEQQSAITAQRALGGVTE